MSDIRYVQPVAIHGSNDGYMIVRDEARTWFLWFGDDERGLEAIPADLAAWMCSRPEMDDLTEPHMWFGVESLPLTGVPNRNLHS